MDHFYSGLVEKVISKAKLISDFQWRPKKKLEFKPFITISRETGSGGRPVAGLVAKKLKFELFDEALVEAVAKSAKRRKELIKSVDEKGRGAVIDMLQSVLNPDYISDMTYIRHVTRVILTRAQQGRVVILGRGANFMIPSKAGLRVRIQAPYSVRVQRAINYEGIDYEQAREYIRHRDSERRSFVKQYFGKNISNANYYDLILNTTHMTLEDTRDLIIRAFKRKFRVK